MASTQKINYEELTSLKENFETNMGEILSSLESIKKEFDSIPHEYWDGKNADSFEEAIITLFDTNKVISKTKSEFNTVDAFLNGVLSTNKKVDSQASKEIEAKI